MVPLVICLLRAAGLRRVGAAWPALLLATSALAQSPVTRPERRPDPLDPKAPVPALVHRSSLKPAGPAAADQPIPWRAANETVARIGGWRVYAREAQAPAPAASAATTGHSGQNGHNGHHAP